MKPVLWLLAAVATGIPGVAGTDAPRYPAHFGPWGDAGAGMAPGRDYGYPYPADLQRGPYPPRAPQGYGYGPTYPAAGGRAPSYGPPGYDPRYRDQYGYGAYPDYGQPAPGYRQGHGQGATALPPYPTALPGQGTPRRGEGGWWFPDPAPRWPAETLRAPAGPGPERAAPYSDPSFWGGDYGAYPPARARSEALPPPPAPQWDYDYPEIDDRLLQSPYGGGYGPAWDLPEGYFQAPDYPPHPGTLGGAEDDPAALPYPGYFDDAFPDSGEPAPGFPPLSAPGEIPPLTSAPPIPFVPAPAGQAPAAPAPVTAAPSAADAVPAAGSTPEAPWPATPAATPAAQ
jgi:hypothetical protein